MAEGASTKLIDGMVERFNGRIEEVLQSHYFRSSEELETPLMLRPRAFETLKKLAQLPGSKTPLQATKDWHKLKPELFMKQPYYLPGCDNYAR